MDEATGEFGGDEPDASDTWNFSIQVAKAWEEAFFTALASPASTIASAVSGSKPPAAMILPLKTSSDAGTLQAPGLHERGRVRLGRDTDECHRAV
jgi:hypothetical protein